MGGVVKILRRSNSLSRSFFSTAGSFGLQPKNSKLLRRSVFTFLLRLPFFFLRRGSFFERPNVCNSPEKYVRTRCAAIVNQNAIVNSLRVVHLLRIVL